VKAARQHPGDARACLAAIALLGLGGCASLPERSTGGGPGSGEVVQVNIITSPVGLDLNGKPGLDGFSAKLYANSARNPKPVPIRSGTIEIVMFDGTLFGRTNLPPALATWTFPAAELRPGEFTAGIGTGYNLILPWGTNRPTQRMVTVGARYTSPSGLVITSSPSSVTVIDR
jgi:hypothetical protein